MQMILLSVIFIDISLGLFVISQDTKKIANIVFFLISILASLWTFSHYMMNISTSIIWIQSAYAIGSLLISFGLIWAMIVTETVVNIKKVYIILIINLFFFLGSYKTGFIIDTEEQITLGAIFQNNIGWGLSLYTFYYLIAAFLMILIISRKLKKVSAREYNLQLKFIALGMSISLLITAFSSFILPMFSIFLPNGIDSIGFLLFLFSVSYAIAKHHLFNIKIVTIQIILFVIWFFIFINLLVINDSKQKILINIVILFTSVLFGIFFTKITRYLIRQNEKIDGLNIELLKTYKHIKNLEKDGS